MWDETQEVISYKLFQNMLIKRESVTHASAQQGILISIYIILIAILLVWST